MCAVVTGELSLSFMKLQRLARSFDEAAQDEASDDATGSGDPTVLRPSVLRLPVLRPPELRLIVELATTALPLCLREMASGNERRARWAELLLAHLATHPEHRPRVLGGLRELAQRGGAGGLRALAMLADLDPPAEARGSADEPLRELIAGLRTPADVALAADRMVTDLEANELLDLLDALSDGDPRRALLLTDELLLRNDLDERCKSALRRVRAPLDDRRHSLGAHWPPRPRAGRRAAASARVGRHDSGRLVVIASRTVPGSRPRRLRVLAVLIAPEGTLLDGLHGADFSQARLERELLAPLRRSGYRFASAPASKAALVVRGAAQASLRLGRLLPQAFYLGRDLLGIYDEHALALNAGGGPSALLDRAMDLLAAGHVRRARPILERHLAQAPESAEGHATMARCLIELSELDPARAHLLRAEWLDPGNPLHHWNLAAVAHRQSRQGGCYLALFDYLELLGERIFDHATGECEPRRDIAERFVDEYERLARLEHPQAEPHAVARADELLYRARMRLHGGNWQDAIPLLEQAVALVSSHYPAWTHLGIAHGESDRESDARQCLRRALSLRPSYPLAVTALAHLDARRAPKPPLRSRRRRRRPSGAEETQHAP